jgi:tetratricopeptide (TPR) repeat protein
LYNLYLGIFDIRNAISHPNRAFPLSYWFRAAAIASDPLIEKLGLVKVSQALNAAMEENLNSPPEEWFENVRWAIPNTLPNSFDHEITGLLGRDKEFRDLHATFSKVRNNLIAVVAPGGIGKTALILQFLKDLSLSPNYSNKVNAIVFCTLKNERLTTDGIEQIEAINGVEQIKESILEDLNSLYGENSYSSFENACEELETEKILICIDNLETLLMQSQKEFIEFNESLPLYWRVIVTSRISIDSATTVPIESLMKRHAINLGRNYFKKRGVLQFSNDDLERIVDKANNNPLAIRLTIDLYIKGVDISQSIKKSQQDIASFSYKNLIESLNPNSVSILESIYVLGNSTKAELIDFLELRNDEVIECINELSKTSLIIRSSNEIGVDSYKLSDSIRDLLLVNPKNIEVRSKISESLKEIKTKILEQTKRNKQLGLTEFEESFVEINTDRSTHALIVDLNKFFSKPYVNRNHIELTRLKGRFTTLITHNSNDYQLYYHYSRVLKVLKDRSGEMGMLDKSQKLNLSSPRTKHAMGMHYFYNSDYEKAEIIFSELITKGYGNPSNASSKFSFSLTKLRFLCLLHLAEYNKVLTITNDWINEPIWSIIYGTYRASAFKRKTELKRFNVEEMEKSIVDSLSIFELIFRNGDYPIVACVESKKMVKDFDFILSNNNYSKEILSEYIGFIARHYFYMVSRLKSESIDSRGTQEFLEKVYNVKLKPNPLHSVKWYSVKSEINYDENHIQELKEGGYEIVEVYHIPEYSASYFMFAKDENENQFYLNIKSFEYGFDRWGLIRTDSKLAILFDKILEGKPTPAIEITTIDEY